MAAKVTELTALQHVEVMGALRIAASQYMEISDSRKAAGWNAAAATYRRWSENCAAIAELFENCDRVTIETDEVADGTCPECGTVHSGLLDCRSTPLDRR